MPSLKQTTWFFISLVVFSLVVFVPAETSDAHPEYSFASCHLYFDTAEYPACSYDNLVDYFGEKTWIAQEIASAESSCDPSAQREHDVDVGLFQVNQNKCGATYTCSRTGESATLRSRGAGCLADRLDVNKNKIVACALVERRGGDDGSEFGDWGNKTSAWGTVPPDVCNLIPDIIQNYCPYTPGAEPQADDGTCGTWSGEPGTGGSGGGGSSPLPVENCETPTLGPINCSVDFPAIPTPSGMFDLNDLCEEGAQITIGALVAYVYYASLWISGIIAFVSLLYAGIMYMLSGAKPSSRAKAKERLSAVLWGIAILFLAVILMNLINPDITNLEISPLAIVDSGNCGSSTDDGIGEPIDCSEETYTCGFSLSGQECTVASACKPGCRPADFVCSEYSPLLDTGSQCSALEETGPWACEPITPPGEYYCTWSDSGSCVQAEEYCATGYTPNEESLCEDMGTAEECLNAGPQQCVSSGSADPYNLGAKQALCSTGYECQPWCGSVSNEADTRLKTDSRYVNWPGMWPADQTANIDDLNLAGWVSSSSRNSGVANYTPFLEALQKAGQTAQSRGYQLFLTSGHRPLYDQVRVLCWGGGRNANAGAMDSVIGRLVARPGLSNHGVGVAVDLALYRGGARLTKTAATCSAMAKIMYDSDPGWYRLGHEDWHFEFWANGAPSSSRTRSAFNCT